MQGLRPEHHRRNSAQDQSQRAAELSGRAGGGSGGCSGRRSNAGSGSSGRRTHNETSALRGSESLADEGGVAGNGDASAGRARCQRSSHGCVAGGDDDGGCGGDGGRVGCRGAGRRGRRRGVGSTGEWELAGVVDQVLALGDLERVVVGVGKTLGWRPGVAASCRVACQDSNGLQVVWVALLQRDGDSRRGITTSPLDGGGNASGHVCWNLGEGNGVCSERSCDQRGAGEEDGELHYCD